jgi:hypothetical protein
MESQSQYGPITSFLMRLADDEELLSTWCLSRRKALAGQGLSAEDEELLVAGDFRDVRDRVMKENRSEGAAAPYMLIYMR